VTIDPLLGELRDRFELRDLVERYGAAADAADRQAFADVFTVDGALVTSQGIVIAGQATLAGVVDGLVSRYRRTMHFVGRQTVVVNGDAAEGTVTCLAHHLYDADRISRDTLMLMQYADLYRRSEGGWRIARREIDVAWTLDRPVIVGA
jgi:uncharacterized protein (TIGR02246 family)